MSNKFISKDRPDFIYLFKCLESRGTIQTDMQEIQPELEVWTLFGEHYFRKGNVEEARKLLPRSLQSLEQRKRELTLMPEYPFLTSPLQT